MRKTFAVAVFLLLTLAPAFAASVEKASLLRRHGLLPQAKVELIDVIFSTAADPIKARAYYDLGSIAFEENNVTAALETWTQLVQIFPNSEQAGLVKDRIKELAEIVGKVSRVTVENAVAESYLRHADFWSKDKDEIFRIDSSWIPKVEAACKWYDKVITEFPKTNASWLAYEGKLRTLLGWKERGEHGQAYGVERDFATYIPQVLSTFAAFETDHPDASSLQAFRFQIAQAWWGRRDWAMTRQWLNVIIEKSGDKDSFYKDLAERRLKKIEY